MKKTFGLLIFFVMLAATGCVGNQGNRPITGVDIQQGTEGLGMVFLENAPPSEAFEKGIIPVGIHITNKGAYPVTNGLLSIALESDYMEINEFDPEVFGEKISFEDPERTKIRFDLPGKTVENPSGEEDILTLRLNTKKIDELSEKRVTPIRISACYGYQTRLDTTACIDTDIYNTRGREKACKVQNMRFSSQGAPVAIKIIEPHMSPHEAPYKVKPQFIIQIGNAGKGETTTDNVVEDACSAKPLKYDDVNVVKVSAYLGGERKELNCEPKKEGAESAGKSGFVKLRKNDGLARCVLEEGIDINEGTYTSPLEVVLDYGYTFTISKDVTVKKSLIY